MGLTSGGWTGRRTGTGLPPTAVAGVLLGAAAIAEPLARAASSDWSLPNVLLLSLLGLAGALPLTFLPPPAATAVMLTASVLSLAGFQMLTAGAFVATLIGFHRLGRTEPRPGVAFLLTSAATVAFLLLALLIRPAREVEVLTIVLAALTSAVAWAGATQRAQADAEQRGAAREAIMGRLLEHTARGARTRIARELHDVVAHHISMIAVQAETARVTTPGLPAAGAQRLSEIGDAARAALTEMRRLLGVLREDTEIEEVPDRQPPPGLHQLNQLLDDVRDANRAGTRLIMRGHPVPLESGIELAAYRIVQEALTNARRHAPGAAVDVELVYTRGALLLRIRDNGPGPPPATFAPSAPLAEGHGLLGMRERAAAVGGRLTCGAAPSGGFLVEASLPARADRSALSAVDTVDVETGSLR
jgi:signal transduction histidine kinase